MESSSLLLCIKGIGECQPHLLRMRAINVHTRAHLTCCHITHNTQRAAAQGAARGAGGMAASTGSASSAGGP